MACVDVSGHLPLIAITAPAIAIIMNIPRFTGPSGSSTNDTIKTSMLMMQTSTPMIRKAPVRVLGFKHAVASNAGKEQEHARKIQVKGGAPRKYNSTEKPNIKTV